jgi:hypothetical protein
MNEPEKNAGPAENGESERDALVEALVEKNENFLKLKTNLKAGVKAGSLSGQTWIQSSLK